MSDSRATASYSLGELCEICNGRAIGEPNLRFTRPGVDSRTVEPGMLFVALPGERVDGHGFVSNAFRRGATVALIREGFLTQVLSRLRAEAEYPVGEAGLPDGMGLCVVDDALRALHRLAAAHLARFPGLYKIGVTGSNGKTTTKELIASILSRSAPTFATAGNYNSEIGLPLTIFDLTPEHVYGVFELAMNRRGEIAVLADLVRPNCALITNIGTAHVGNLGSVDAIAEEKRQIFSRFDGTQTAFVFEGDEYREYLIKGLKGAVRTFGEKSSERFAGYELRGIAGAMLRYAGASIRLPLPGVYNVRNALAAIAVAEDLGIAPELVQQGLEQVPAMFGQAEILSGAVTVLRDCYNANPDSVREALALVGGLDWPGRRVLVIGAMKELGAESMNAHQEIYSLAINSGVDAAFFVGEEFSSFRNDGVGSEVTQVYFAPDVAAIEPALSKYLQEGDFVLLKGSRSIALEELSSVLTAVAGAGAE